MSLYKCWTMVHVESKPTTAEVYGVLTGAEWRWQCTSIERGDTDGLHVVSKPTTADREHWASRQRALRVSSWWRVMSWQRALSMAESKCGRKSALKLVHVVSKPTTAQLYHWVFGSGVVVESRRQCWLREKKKKLTNEVTWLDHWLSTANHCCSPLPPPPPTPPLFTTTTTTTTTALQHHWHCTCPHLQHATTN